MILHEKTITHNLSQSSIISQMKPRFSFLPIEFDKLISLQFKIKKKILPNSSRLFVLIRMNSFCFCLAKNALKYCITLTE